MGVIYINDGFRKAKQPVNIGKSDINISCDEGQNLDIFVEGDGNMVVSSEDTQLDNVVQDEILNIV